MKSPEEIEVFNSAAELLVAIRDTPYVLAQPERYRHLRTDESQNFAALDGIADAVRIGMVYLQEKLDVRLMPLSDNLSKYREDSKAQDERFKLDTHSQMIELSDYTYAKLKEAYDFLVFLLVFLTEKAADVTIAEEDHAKFIEGLKALEAHEGFNKCNAIACDLSVKSKAVPRLTSFKRACAILGLSSSSAGVLAAAIGIPVSIAALMGSSIPSTLLGFVMDPVALGVTAVFAAIGIAAIVILAYTIAKDNRAIDHNSRREIGLLKASKAGKAVNTERKKYQDLEKAYQDKYLNASVDESLSASVVASVVSQ